MHWASIRPTTKETARTLANIFLKRNKLRNALHRIASRSINVVMRATGRTVLIVPLLMTRNCGVPQQTARATRRALCRRAAVVRGTARVNTSSRRQSARSLKRERRSHAYEEERGEGETTSPSRPGRHRARVPSLERMGSH